jgi:hypothetical protein
MDRLVRTFVRARFLGIVAFFALLLSCATLLSFWAGCGSNSEPSVQSASGHPPAQSGMSSNSAVLAGIGQNGALFGESNSWEPGHWACRTGKLAQLSVTNLGSPGSQIVISAPSGITPDWDEVNGSSLSVTPVFRPQDLFARPSPLISRPLR